ncbi:MAG: hypothetical protein IRY83_17700 [Chloroflexi bacterium]|nr:hypothetical protein [Chloroflexota bacterium]
MMAERGLRQLIETANRRMKPDRIIVGTPEGDRAIEDISRLMDEFGESAWGTAPAWSVDGWRPDE